MTFVAKDFGELTAGEVYEILKSRMEIFMLEQKILCLDADDVDYRARHCFLEDGGRVVAYLRAFECKSGGGNVKIGRVLSLTHRSGLGTELMIRSICDLKEHFHCRRLLLDSQKHAVGFYEKFGFRVISGEFPEEGILHVTMELDLEKEMFF